MATNEGGSYVWEGIQLVWVVLGFFGAAIGVSRLPPMSKYQLLSALASGVFFATQAPQWASWAFVHLVPAGFNPAHENLPAFVNNGIAFFFGVGGMFIVPGIIVFWQEFSKNPLQALSRTWAFFRGKPLPPDPEDIAGEHK